MRLQAIMRVTTTLSLIVLLTFILTGALTAHADLIGSLGSAEPTPWDMAFRVVTISTPFALLWLATIQASRAKLMQNIDTRLSQLDARINTGNEECHEDIQAMRAQVAAFQREVASQYAPRAEIAHSFHEIREEFRQFRTELFRGRPL